MTSSYCFADKEKSFAVKYFVYRVVVLGLRVSRV